MNHCDNCGDDIDGRLPVAGLNSTRFCSRPCRDAYDPNALDAIDDALSEIDDFDEAEVLGALT